MAKECMKLKKELELKAEDYIMKKLNLHVRGFDEIHCNIGVLMKLVGDYAYDVTKELQAQIYKMRDCQNCSHCGGYTDEAGNSICDSCDDDMSEWEMSLGL